jgi:peptidyl-prolyl cis-trans isomerase SurA
LIGEYHDGILLFNLMDEMVWSKAISDTVGLKKFYEDNKINYMWPNRLDVQIYSTKNNKLYKKLYKKIKKGDVDNDLLSCFNKNSELNLSLDNLLVSEGDNMMIDTLLFSLDSVSEGQFVAQDSEYKILYIKSIIPPSYKLLNEIKGLVISDYQLLLEKGWLEQLRNKHAVVLNKELFFLAQQKRLNELPVISDSLIVPNSYTGNFESAFYNAVNELGSSKDIYFEWYGNLYTTELKSLE